MRPLCSPCSQGKNARNNSLSKSSVKGTKNARTIDRILIPEYYHTSLKQTERTQLMKNVFQKIYKKSFSPNQLGYYIFCLCLYKLTFFLCNGQCQNQFSIDRFSVATSNKVMDNYSICRAGHNNQNIPSCLRSKILKKKLL